MQCKVFHGSNRLIRGSSPRPGDAFVLGSSVGGHVEIENHREGGMGEGCQDHVLPNLIVDEKGCRYCSKRAFLLGINGILYTVLV